MSKPQGSEWIYSPANILFGPQWTYCTGSICYQQHRDKEGLRETANKGKQRMALSNVVQQGHFFVYLKKNCLSVIWQKLSHDRKKELKAINALEL